MTSYIKTIVIYCITILNLFCFLQLSFAQTVVTISFDNPSIVPPACNMIFTEEGIPQQLVDLNGSCSYDYDSFNGVLWLFPATLSVDISSLGSIERVEIDVTDFCGLGCSQTKLLNNGVVVNSAENMDGGILETLVLDNSNLLPVDEVTLSSFEGQFAEIRITYIDLDPCEGTGDSDNDSICDALDVCPGFDDRIDRDGNGIPDYCDICDFNRTLMEASESGDNLEYVAINTITSGQLIKAGADITFSAGFEVDLIAGFEVEQNAVFLAIIEGCVPPSLTEGS